MTRVDGLVRGMPKRVPSPNPGTYLVASGSATGGSHSFTIPDEVQDGDLCVTLASSRNSNIGATANSGTGATWSSVWYVDVGTDEEIRVCVKYAKNESGNWTISQSGTGCAGYMVLRASNPHLKPNRWSTVQTNQSSTSQSLWVPDSSTYIYLRAGCYNGGVSPIGEMTTQGHRFHEVVFRQQSVDEFVSMWFADVPFTKGFSGIYRAGNDAGYQGSCVFYARRAGS